MLLIRCVKVAYTTLKLRVDGNSKYHFVTCLLVHFGNIDPSPEHHHYRPKWHQTSVILRSFQMFKGYGYDSSGVQEKWVIQRVCTVWWKWTRHDYSVRQVNNRNGMLDWSSSVLCLQDWRIYGWDPAGRDGWGFCCHSLSILQLLLTLLLTLFMKWKMG